MLYAIRAPGEKSVQQGVGNDGAGGAGAREPGPAELLSLRAKGPSKVLLTGRPEARRSFPSISL